MTSIGRWVLCVLVAPVVAGAQMVPGTPVQVTTDPGAQLDPAISGDVVVYTDQRNGNDDVYYFDFSTGTETQMTSAANAQRLSDVDGPLIVSTNVDGAMRTIILHDTRDGSSTIVGSGAANQNPRIDGNVVVFEHGPATNQDVYAVDLTTSLETPVAATTAWEINPVVSDGRIVYQRHSGTASSPADIVIVDLATGIETVLEGTTADARRPDIDGDVVVWDVRQPEGDTDIAIHRLSTGATTIVARPGNQRGPHVSGGIVSFDDDSAGDPNVGLYSVASGVVAFAAGGPDTEFLNDVSGNRIVYTSNEAGNLDIWALELADVEVTPTEYDFGEVAVGAQSTQISTVSNAGLSGLTVSGVAFAAGSSADFSIASILKNGAAVSFPATLAVGESLDALVKYRPMSVGAAAAGLEIASDDFDEPLVTVALEGEGVAVDTPPSQQVRDLLAYFDAAVSDGSLVGTGPGSSPTGRRKALRNMIVAVGDLIDAGELEDACRQIQDVLARCDGTEPPPDFVAGPAAAGVAERVRALQQAIGCNAS